MRTPTAARAEKVLRVAHRWDGKKDGRCDDCAQYLCPLKMMFHRCGLSEAKAQITQSADHSRCLRLVEPIEIVSLWVYEHVFDRIISEG